MVDGRRRGKTLEGVVSSDKMEKTIIVDVERLVKHPLYGKYVRRTMRLWAHDEHNEAKIGDVVRVMETRPLSKNKRWRLVEILRRSYEGKEGEIKDAGDIK
ncbi:MAG: 30S ribosomal protein S17 [Planctomycetota bacterium]|nr:30S ribosomal protein S17 [Planctomycetota bacterium]